MKFLIKMSYETTNNPYQLLLINDGSMGDITGKYKFDDLFKHKKNQNEHNQNVFRTLQCDLQKFSYFPTE